MTTKGITPLTDETLTQVVGGAAAAAKIGDPGTDDVMNGTFRSDLLFGGGGHDSISGHGGNDLISGGEGDDTLMGGEGDDRLAGGAGADVVNGEDGNDYITWQPGDGNDTIDGGAGTDILRLTDVTLAQFMEGLVLDPGSAAPTVGDRGVDVTGCSGTLTINGETLRFTGLENIHLVPRLEP